MNKAIDRFLRMFIMKFGQGVFYCSVGEKKYMFVVTQTFDDD